MTIIGNRLVDTLTTIDDHIRRYHDHYDCDFHYTPPLLINTYFVIGTSTLV